MPKYVNRTTGEIVYPDQIRNGEVTNYVEVADYPQRWTNQGNNAHPGTLSSAPSANGPMWDRVNNSPATNPFTKWVTACNVIAIFTIIGGMYLGYTMAQSGVSSSAGAIFVAIVFGGIVAALPMILLYLLVHIGHTIWETKEEVRKLNAATK